MTASAQYTEYVLELLAPLGAVRTRRFFGGVALLRGTTQFGMIMGNNLYFVVDDRSREKYLALGMEPFSYLTKNGNVYVRRYFMVPQEILEDPAALRQWVIEAIDVAADKPARTPRKRSAPLRKTKKTSTAGRANRTRR